MWWKIPVGIILALVIGIYVLLQQTEITPGIIVHSLFGIGAETPADETVKSRFKVPAGFTVGVYASGVNNARHIEFSNTGDLVVAQPRESKVTLIERDSNGDGRADGMRTLVDDLVRPASVDFHDGYLYVGESTGVGRIPFDHETGETTGEYERVINGLADGGNHWTKTIRFGPDGLLYLSSGSTCNVCIEADDQRATITRYQPDGTGEERFATGIRNSVGFDWAPFDGHLYATDNGRDLLGDDYPPCELNKVELGKFYGWPYVNGFGDLDPDLGDESKLADAVSPVHGFRAHNAPLGIRFLDNPAFPPEYGKAALVALHGSWNRSSYDGYKVVSLHYQPDGSFEERDFLAGFELDGDIIGRPVDVAIGPDNCAYVSDDYAMVILRVCYGEAQSFAMGSDAAQPAFEMDLDEPLLSELSKRGERIYQTRGCLGCHVVNNDDPPFGMRPLKAINQKYDFKSLAAFYKTPTPPMPPVRLNEEDEKALSVFLLGLD